MAGVTFAKPAFRQHVHPLHLRARVLPGQRSEDFTGVVGGPIIHDDQLDLHAALCQQMTNRLPDPRFLVPGRNDHGAADQIAA